MNSMIPRILTDIGPNGQTEMFESLRSQIVFSRFCMKLVNVLIRESGGSVSILVHFIILVEIDDKEERILHS